MPDFSCPDHPVIQNMMRTGYPDGKEPAEIKCPVCGEDGEHFYVTKCGMIVGCDICLTAKPYWEFEAEEDY